VPASSWCTRLSAAPARAQGNRQVTKAAVEWYGPDRAGFLGPFTDPPSYLNGEYPGDYGAPRPAPHARHAHAAHTSKCLPSLLFLSAVAVYTQLYVLLDLQCRRLVDALPLQHWRWYQIDRR